MFQKDLDGVEHIQHKTVALGTTTDTSRNLHLLRRCAREYPHLSQELDHRLFTIYRLDSTFVHRSNRTFQTQGVCGAILHQPGSYCTALIKDTA